MKIIRTLAGAPLLLCAVLFAGCASPAQPGNMVVNTVVHNGTPHGAVTVRVTGGHKTDPMWASQIAGKDFQTALVESLRKSGIFQSVDADGNAPYRLDVRLDSLDQPVFGFDITVKLRADWSLSKSQDDNPLWQQPILSEYTATVGDAFAGIKRLRLADEGAARANIEQGLNKLSAMQLDP
ncbi:MAG TPA: hypothetical protein VN873_18885 [Candidatus Angelobacter sp.]|nr:hypothetical protein [Candidatus Angelobacter sp.]